MNHNKIKITKNDDNDINNNRNTVSKYGENKEL